MANAERIEGTEEAWDARLLGADESFVAVADEGEEAAINEELGLKMISIRLEKALIEDLKAIATIHGLGYQTLMRQALTRFADCEKKIIVRDMAAQMAAKAGEAQVAEPKAQKAKQKKAA